MRRRTKGGMSEREDALLRLGLDVCLIHCTAVSSLNLNAVVSSSLVPVLVLSVHLSPYVYSTSPFALTKTYPVRWVAIVHVHCMAME